MITIPCPLEQRRNSDPSDKNRIKTDRSFGKEERLRRTLGSDGLFVLFCFVLISLYHFDHRYAVPGTRGLVHQQKHTPQHAVYHRGAVNYLNLAIQ
jgi:hypothetical protein